MKMKEYPSLEMTTACRDDDDMKRVVMAQVGDLPLGPYLFDEDEMSKMADKIAEVVNDTVERMLDTAVAVGDDVNKVAAYAFIYLACQGIRDHVSSLAQIAAMHLAAAGTDMLHEKLGEDGLKRLIRADHDKRYQRTDPALTAIIDILFPKP